MVIGVWSRLKNAPRIIDWVDGGGKALGNRLLGDK